METMRDKAGVYFSNPGLPGKSEVVHFSGNIIG